MQTNESIAAILALGNIVPVATIPRTEQAVPMAKSLLEQGIRTIEVTLRTDCALEAIRTIRKEVPDITVGAGTIVSVETFDAAAEAGAAFIVSPGTTDALLAHAAKQKVAFLPGAATVSDVMRITAYGIQYLKFFPAVLAGGVPMLKNLNALFPQVTFCPTGGINAENMQDYLALPNVACVGGSWVIS